MKIFIMLLTLLASPIAMADSYIGIGGGVADVSETRVDDNGNKIGVDDNAMAAYIYGGYQMNEYLSLELSYLKTASFNAYYDEPLDKAYVEAWMPMLNLHYIKNDFKLSALVGNALWQVRFNDKGAAVNDESTNFSFGVAIEYNPAKWGIRTEWRRIEFDGDVVDEGDFDVILVSISRYF